MHGIQNIEAAFNVDLKHQTNFSFEKYYSLQALMRAFDDF